MPPQGANFGFNALGPSAPPVVWFENAALGIGKLMCAEVSREQATWHTRVTCKVPEGGGAHHSTFVQAGDQIGELPDSLRCVVLAVLGWWVLPRACWW